MDRGESFDRRGRDFDPRNRTGLKRECGKERERQGAHCIAKLRSIGAVPGINRVERTKRVERSAFHNAYQVEAGVGDGSRAAGEADQRQNGALGPHFGVIGTRGFQLGQRKNHVADRAGANQQASMH